MFLHCVVMSVHWTHLSWYPVVVGCLLISCFWIGYVTENVLLSMLMPSPHYTNEAISIKTIECVYSSFYSSKRHKSFDSLIRMDLWAWQCHQYKWLKYFADTFLFRFFFHLREINRKISLHRSTIFSFPWSL